MPIYTLQGPDGKKYKVEGPAGASETDLSEFINTQPQIKKDKPFQALRDIGSGLIRGAGSIGATIISPYDVAMDAIDGKGLSLQSNNERRQKIDDFLEENIGANPKNLLYSGGKIGAEIAGTLPVGSVLSGGAKLLGASKNVADAIKTGGLVAGDSGIATRMASGALSGGAGAMLINPNVQDASIGAGIGAALPPGVKVASKVGQILASPVKLVAPFTKSGSEKIAGNFFKNAGVSQATSSMSNEIVPGSAPTLSQAMMTSDVARLQKVLSAKMPDFADDLAVRAAEQNMARTNYLGSIAKNVDDLTSAINERNIKTAAIRDSALTSGKPNIQAVSDTVDMMLSGTSRLRSNAENALLKIKDKLSKSNNSKDLYAVRQEIDDLLSGRVGDVDKGARFAAKDLMVVKNNIDEALNASSKGKFSKYLENYQDLSKPINRMELAQEFQNKILPNINTATSQIDVFGNPMMTPASFNRALKSPNEFLGNTRTMDKALEETLNIGDYGAIQDISRDLARQDIAAKLGASPGSDTFQNFITNNNVMGLTDKFPKPPFLGWITDYYKDQAMKKPLQNLSAGFLNPSEAIRLSNLVSNNRSISGPFISRQTSPALSGIGGSYLPAYLESD